MEDIETNQELLGKVGTGEYSNEFATLNVLMAIRDLLAHPPVENKLNTTENPYNKAIPCHFVGEYATNEWFCTVHNKKQGDCNPPKE